MACYHPARILVKEMPSNHSKYGHSIRNRWRLADLLQAPWTSFWLLISNTRERRLILCINIGLTGVHIAVRFIESKFDEDFPLSAASPHPLPGRRQPQK
jgi:hypothetical protein